MKKILSMVLTVAMLLSCMALLALPTTAEVATGPAFDGVNNLAIYTVEDFMKFYNNCWGDKTGSGDSADQLLGKTVTLENDLVFNDITSEAWLNKDVANLFEVKSTTSAGWSSFRGTFDGKGHTIQGVYMAQTQNGCLGLFPYLVFATIKDLTIDGFYISGGVSGKGVGVLTGMIDGYATFENCVIKNGIVEGASGTYVGTISGNSNFNSPNGSVVIKKCRVENSVEVRAKDGATDVTLGGILGRFYKNQNGSNYSAFTLTFEMTDSTFSPKGSVNMTLPAFGYGEQVNKQYNTSKLKYGTTEKWFTDMTTQGGTGNLNSVFNNNFNVEGCDIYGTEVEFGGASIRYEANDTNKNGIRFKTCFPASAVTADPANFGVILMSAAKYEAVKNSLTLQTAKDNGVELSGSVSATVEAYSNVKAYELVATVYNIPEANLDDDIVVIAYIGDAVYVVGQRSIYSVAKAVVNAGTENADAIAYCQGIVDKVTGGGV